LELNLIWIALQYSNTEGQISEKSLCEIYSIDLSLTGGGQQVLAETRNPIIVISTLHSLIILTRIAIYMQSIQILRG
jgi:hypothetical protein